ncbi:MAG: MarR family transcriptional regulator [Chloroflexi bacterium]|nr:MarR family transcriptional regulator [Chloroflexota bacterium]
MKSKAARKDKTKDKTQDRTIDSAVKEFRELAAGQKFRTSTSALYTGLLINKYLNTMSDSLSVRYRTSMDILYVLLIYGGSLTPSDLSRLTCRSKQTVTHIIDKLEEEGLVKRGPIGTDRRTRQVNVTRKGAEIAKQSLIGLRQFVNNVMPDEIGDEQMKGLESVLYQIRKRLHVVMGGRTGRR